MKLYISGPMRGYPALNYAAFDAAARRIQLAGWVPVNPADIDRASCDPTPPESQAFMRNAMQRDIAALWSCDQIALLPGWRHSQGAVAEVAIACVVGMRARDAVSLDDITDDVLEWWHALTGKRR